MLTEIRRRSSELADAASRLRAGAYGICERCGQPIAFDRLVAQPAARACVGCAAPAAFRRTSP